MHDSKQQICTHIDNINTELNELRKIVEQTGENGATPTHLYTLNLLLGALWYAYHYPLYHISGGDTTEYQQK